MANGELTGCSMSCSTRSIGRSTPDVEHERAVAIFDLIEENSFRPVDATAAGPTGSKCRWSNPSWFSRSRARPATASPPISCR